MLQAALDLDTLATDHADRVGFDLGWDHAHHGLVPPVGLMLEGSPLRQGWAAGRAVFGSRTLSHGRTIRQWLELRLRAWREGVAYESLQLTPHYLAQLDTPRCPVTLRPLGGTGDDAPVLQRLRRDAGYAAGHLVTLSAAAARALRSLPEGHEIDAAFERMRQHGAPGLESASDASAARAGEAMNVAAWQRLGVLLSFVTPLPHARAARLPLVLLPPNRLRVLNAVQGLQVVLSWGLAQTGWSGRLRELAMAIEEAPLRHDFLLFVGALAPRVMGLPDGSDAQALREALGELWQDARVMRRWALFAGGLDAARAEQLAQRAAAFGLKGRRAMVHAQPAATEGWEAAQVSRLVAASFTRRGLSAARAA